MATHTRKKTHNPPPSATSTSGSSRSTATKPPPVAEIRLADSEQDDVIELDASIEEPARDGGTELNFSDCDTVSEAEEKSQDLLLRKPKQSTVELLLGQQTQETQESIMQQTSDMAAGTVTQDSLAEATAVGKQQALAFRIMLDDDSRDENDVDMCCASDQCRVQGLIEASSSL